MRGGKASTAAALIQTEQNSESVWTSRDLLHSSVGQPRAHVRVRVRLPLPQMPSQEAGEELIGNVKMAPSVSFP